MNIDQTLEQLSHLRCPRQVDVTDRVMAHAMQHPYLIHHSSNQTFRHSDIQKVVWHRVGIAAVAAVFVLMIVNVTTVYTRSYDDEGLGSMIAQANDYSSWNTVEELAVNPYEYLYEEL